MRTGLQSVFLSLFLSSIVSSMLEMRKGARASSVTVVEHALFPLPPLPPLLQILSRVSRKEFTS